MKLDDFRRGKMPMNSTTEVTSVPSNTAEPDFGPPVSDAEMAVMQAKWDRTVENWPRLYEMSGGNPMHSTTVAAEMTRVFQTIRVGDSIQIGHKEIVVTEQMWKDARHCLSEMLGYQWACWVFPNTPEDATTSITRIYLSTLLWRFYVDYISDEPPGLGLCARLKYRFWPF
jgi:hypothetical protein